MARGYPDFFGFSIFPFYGAIRYTGETLKVLPGGVETEIFTIIGKGRIWGGEWQVIHGTNLPAISLNIYIDEDLAASISCSDSIDKGYAFPVGTLIYGTYYDQIKGRRAYGLIVPNQTFGQSWSIKINNGDAAGGSGTCSATYTLFK